MQNRDSIAIVLNGLYVGGAEKFGISLANKFVEKGFSTFIILFKNFDSPLFQEIDSRIEIQTIKRKSKYDFILKSKFEKILEEKKITKVIIIGLLPLFLSRIFSLKKNSITYFLSLHSTIPASFKIYLQNLFFFTIGEENG